MTDEHFFEQLIQHAREISLLKSTMAALEWDQQTYLPTAGGPFRAEQITQIAGLIHQRETDPQFGEIINQLADSELAADEHSVSGSTIRELKHQYNKKTKLPQELVEQLAKTSSVGQQIWIEARKENDYQKFAPILGEILELKRQQADAIGFADCRYDAMLDDYEPGVVTRDVEQVLNDLRTELVPLVQQIGECSGPAPTNIVDRDFPIAIQREIGRMAAEKIGFDFNRGRIDVAAHPFCTTLGPRDIRLTTRFDRKHFNGAFFGTLHEAGHGIYEQGLPEEHFGLPPGSYCSLGIHESQSRMWENLVGRSHGFWEYFYPTVQKKFADSLGNVAQDDFVAAINQCAPSLIRVEADEATYNLHIIIRFELEKSLIENQLSVNDLPEAWNQKYEQYLGIRPAGDANGVLQDVHWSAGLIGYFPTYSLGNVFASQFFAAAEKELGDLEPPFRKGDFESLKNWLNANIHQLGGRYRSYDLVKKITGTGVDHRDLIAHLKSKFGRFYGIAV